MYVRQRQRSFFFLSFNNNGMDVSISSPAADVSRRDIYSTVGESTLVAAPHNLPVPAFSPDKQLTPQAPLLAVSSKYSPEPSWA